MTIVLDDVEENQHFQKEDRTTETTPIGTCC